MYETNAWGRGDAASSSPRSPSGRVNSGFDEIWPIRWSPPIRIRRCASQNTVSLGLWPGRWMTSSDRSRSSQRAAGLERTRDDDARSPRPVAGRHRAQRVDHVPGNPMTQQLTRGEAVVELHVLPEALEVGRQLVEGRNVAPRPAGDDRREADVVHVLVRQDQQTDLLDPVAQRVEAPLEFIERDTRVRTRVDQRQRVVVDHVEVDRADRERRRYRKTVDAGGGGDGKRLAPLRSRADQLEHLVPAAHHVLRWRRAIRGRAAGAARCSTSER